MDEITLTMTKQAAVELFSVIAAAKSFIEHSMAVMAHNPKMQENIPDEITELLITYLMFTSDEQAKDIATQVMKHVSKEEIDGLMTASRENLQRVAEEKLQHAPQHIRDHVEALRKAHNEGLPLGHASMFSGGFVKHKCLKEGCGAVWEHSETDIGDKKMAHSCYKCGTEQWDEYIGEERAMCVNNGKRIEFSN